MSEARKGAPKVMQIIAEAATAGLSGELDAVSKARNREALDMARKVGRKSDGALKRQAKKRRKSAAEEQADENAKVLGQHPREKPTPERIARSALDLVDAARFDTQRAGEKILIDWKARAGGAGEMYLRGQLSRREADAATRLMELYERSQTSQLSCGQVRERVEGGGVDISGARLTAAGDAWGQYEGAMKQLSRWGRFLVQKRVVEGRAMDEIVQLTVLAEALGDAGKSLRGKRAVIMLRDALDHLADIFNLSGA